MLGPPLTAEIDVLSAVYIYPCLLCTNTRQIFSLPLSKVWIHVGCVPWLMCVWTCSFAYSHWFLLFQIFWAVICLFFCTIQHILLQRSAVASYISHFLSYIISDRYTIEYIVWSFCKKIALKKCSMYRLSWCL